MDARQTPAETDIAKMLDSVATCRDGGYPETLHVLRWLIERAPPARALHDRLHAPRDDRPSLIELARLLIAVETGERYPESVYTAHWLIERSPAAAKRLARLERMAADAGLDDGEPDWAVSALKVRAELDRLLATLEDWQEAGEAMELDMQKAYAYQYLLNVCRARIGRTRGEERARLERLRHRLQEGARREIRLPEPEAELGELEEKLRAKVEPEAALETIEGLIRHLRAG